MIIIIFFYIFFFPAYLTRHILNIEKGVMTDGKWEAKMWIQGECRLGKQKLQTTWELLLFNLCVKNGAPFITAKPCITVTGVKSARAERTTRSGCLKVYEPLCSLHSCPDLRQAVNVINE